MKNLSQYIIEAEQSKRLLNPILWNDFLYAYKNKIKLKNTDTIDTAEYFSDEILNSDFFRNTLALHPNYFTPTSLEQYYVICGNTKKSWSQFNIDDIITALGKPIYTDENNKSWKVEYFENCIYCEIKTNQKSNIHWVLIASPNLLNNLGFDI